MKSRWLLMALCTLVVCCMSAAAHADVIYTFSGTSSSGAKVGFTLTSPTYLTGLPGTTINLSQLSTCTNCTSSPVVAAFVPAAVLGSSLLFLDKNNVASVYMFTLGAFGAAGTYTSGGLLFNAGTLVVAVPEASPILFALLGLMTIFGFVVMRRRPAMHIIAS